ncbi:MAG: hypothetical protein U0V48_01530 [Anaerolineales bacterium]
MATVRDMIRKKGSEVYAIPSTASVLEAMKLPMAAHNMGAALVVDGEMKGILSGGTACANSNWRENRERHQGRRDRGPEKFSSKPMKSLKPVCH